MQYNQDAQAVFSDGRVTVRTCSLFGWMIATREGWCPVEQVGNETLRFLKTYIAQEHNNGIYPAVLWSFINTLLLKRPVTARSSFMPLLFT